jgi:transcriptional repressor NrdR
MIRRRRMCRSCEHRFTTYERIEEVLPTVVKRDGSRELFDRSKMLGGLKRACEKRTVPTEKLEYLAAEVERELIETGEREIDSKNIGELVLEHLRHIDEVAYVRFASVYRSFRDADDFIRELKALRGQQDAPTTNKTT